MIGGHGMADAMCAPQYGFAYLDTTGDRIRLYYFEVGHWHCRELEVGFDKTKMYLDLLTTKTSLIYIYIYILMIGLKGRRVLSNY